MECKFRIADTVRLTGLLDMILKNNFVGFDNYVDMPNIDLENQVYAERNILKEDEYLPEEFYQWINRHSGSENLFSRLLTSDCPHISVRQALLDDTKYEVDKSFFSNIENANKINSSIDWAIQQNFTYAFGSNRFRTMMALIENLPRDYEEIPVLKYTGKVEARGAFKDSNPTFVLERYQKESAFLSYTSWRKAQFQERLKKSDSLSEFIRSSQLYVYGDKAFLTKHGFGDDQIWDVQTSVATINFPEYNDLVYQQWKNSEKSKGITIHTSQQPIVTNFNINSSDGNKFTEEMNDDEFGYELEKMVVIQQPNKEGLGIMKTIAKHIASMDFFKEPFIALQTLYLDEYERKQQGKGAGKSNIDLSNSSLTEEQAQDAINHISQETANHLETVNGITKQMNGEDLDKLNDVAKPIKELLGSIEKEDIERLAENKDKLMQMMDDLSQAEKEEKESQVRQTIGFIGELIYGHYLANQGKEYIHAALNGIGEYDFEVESDNMYVDVKTTLYSLKDGTAPFYLHRSQTDFMKKHPDKKYHIIRISLRDLNLNESYIDLRNTYGVNANPMENNELKQHCEQIADVYWKEAKVEEFDAMSPEYQIRFEHKS